MTLMDPLDPPCTVWRPVVGVLLFFGALTALFVLTLI